MPASYFTHHSRFVSITKYVLFFAALILLIALIAMPFINPGQTGYRLSFGSASKKSDSGEVVMDDARFQTVDKEGQPYNILAKKAVQVSSEEVDLFEIDADVTHNNGQWYSLKSDTGKYNLNSKKLILNGNVTIFSGDGYEFKTESMYVDSIAKVVTGDRKIVGQGPLGVLKATGFKIDGNSAKIYFKGRVNVLFYPKK